MTLALTLSTEMELLTLKEQLEKVQRRVIALFDDANSYKPFVPPKPDEDELVSTCVYNRPFYIVVV